MPAAGTARDAGGEGEGGVIAVRWLPTEYTERGCHALSQGITYTDDCFDVSPEVLGSSGYGTYECKHICQF
jgi:hypothetical protein